MDRTSLALLVNIAFNVLWWLIFARVILSYFRPNPYHPVVKFIVGVTDPILNPFQRLIPPVGMIDFSPLVALFILEALRRIILNAL